MSVVIWKHVFPRGSDTSEFDLPEGARVLHFTEQLGQFCIWEAHINGETATQRRAFQIVGTGHPAAIDPFAYVGTTLVDGGRYVFHLFEVAPKPSPSGPEEARP